MIQRQGLAHLAGSEPGAVQAGRRILDHFAVADRLEEIRLGLWRGGTVSFGVRGATSRDDGGHDGGPLDLFYQLAAEWETAVLELYDGQGSRDLVRSHAPLVDGRWRRGKAGYWLRVGIAAQTLPTVIYVRSHRLRYLVPYLDRSDEQVERALAGGLTAYANLFAARCLPVGEAAADGMRLLRRYGL